MTSLTSLKKRYFVLLIIITSAALLFILENTELTVIPIVMAPQGKRDLTFDKSIISTADNPISTNELLSRLTLLQEELSTLNQSSVDLDSLDRYREDLINRKLLRHKDVGVRAFTACCISDILRLYAPDAPYTDTQLTDFFKLTLSQFELLGDPNNGYYTQQKYLILRLLEYRSIVLLTDLPSSPKLVERLFEIFYDDSKKFQQSLYNVMGGILGEVLSELESVPMPVLKVIFNKFLTYNPEEIPKGLAVSSNCGYELSIILCDTYSNRMSRHLTKYYSEILYNVTNAAEGNFYESNIRLSKTIIKLHRLVIRLWATVPELVASIVGFVYHELSSPNEFVRKSATKLVGHLLTIDSNINFAVSHQDTFNAWLSKIADVNPEVRVEWVNTIPAILVARDDISNEISKALSKTFIDSDPQVRKASVLIFDEVPITDVWKCITETSVYSSLLQLTREKNREVRESCIRIVAKFYSESMNKIDKTQQNEKIWQIVETIPNVFFNLYYINDPMINEHVDKMVFEYLLPLEPDNKERVKRLLAALAHFDEKAFAAFVSFNRRQQKMSLALSKYVEFCEFLNNTNTSSYRDDSLESSDLVNHRKELADKVSDISLKYGKTIEWLTSTMADPIKATESLEMLKKINDSRIFYLISTCMKNDVPMATLKNSIKELLGKLQDPGLFRKYDVSTISTILPRDLVNTISVLLYRSAPIIYNVSNIGTFLNLTGNGYEGEVVLKRKLIECAAEVNPTLFKDQMRTLKDIIKNYDDNGDIEGKNDKILTLDETLKTTYRIARNLRDQIEFDDFFVTRLRDLVDGGTPIVAKDALKLLALSPNAEEELSRIRSFILPLDAESDKRFTSHVAALMEMFKFYPQILTDDSTEIVSYLIKEVLLSNRVTGNAVGDIEWIDDQELYSGRNENFIPLANKVLSLKLFTNKLRSITNEVFGNALSRSFTEKTVKLFFYIISSGGELIPETNSENFPTPESYQRKLRLVAGLQILKLSKIANMNSFIQSADCIKLINLVEDESTNVRRQFLDRLKDYISNELISIKFLPLIFFTAYEPNNELKMGVKTWINHTFNKESFRKGTYFERVLPRLIHAVAHHPDIVDGLNSSETEEEYMGALITAIDYLIFYFDSVATQENFSLLYYLSERVKNYQDKLTDDGEDSGKSDATGDQEEEGTHNTGNPGTKIYIIGELSQLILLQLKERKNWQHSAYPGKLNLPVDLFKPFDTIQDARESFRTYIDEKYIERLNNNIKIKVNRIVYVSQTQRQRVQKRMLDSEHQQIATSGNKRPRENRRKKLDDRDAEKDAEAVTHAGDDKAYVPSTKIVYEAGSLRKNLRERKKVDYRVDDDDNEGEDEEMYD